jgi:hypothetical protein
VTHHRQATGYSTWRSIHGLIVDASRSTARKGDSRHQLQADPSNAKAPMRDITPRRRRQPWPVKAVPGRLLSALAFCVAFSQACVAIVLPRGFFSGNHVENLCEPVSFSRRRLIQ